jgi:hypothetical protein
MIYFNTFKFLLRREVLKTYKQLIKSVKLIEDEDYKKGLTGWVRNDFKFNKELKDEVIQKNEKNNFRLLRFIV